MSAGVMGTTCAQKPWITEAQACALETYAGGEFRHLLDLTSQAAYAEALAECGDGLLQFVLTEISWAEGAETLAEAHRRLGAARRDVDELLDALSALVA